MNPKFDNLFVKANKETRMTFGAYNGNVQLAVWKKQGGGAPLFSARVGKGTKFLTKLQTGFKVVNEDNSRRYPIIHNEWDRQSNSKTELATYVISVDERGRFVFEVSSKKLNDSPQQYVFYGDDMIQGMEEEDFSNNEKSAEEFHDFLKIFQLVVIPSAVNSMLDFKGPKRGGNNNGGGGGQNNSGGNRGGAGGEVWG